MPASGPPAPTARERWSDTMVRSWLFAVSYAPLALIFGFRALPDWRGFALGAGFFLVFTAIAWLALQAQKRSAGRPVTLTDPRGQGAAVSGYLATYLLPFLSTAPEGIGGLLAYITYFLVALVVYIRSDLALVNPTFSLLGYRIYEASDGRRRTLVLSRDPVQAGVSVRVTDFLDVYVVKQSAP